MEGISIEELIIEPTVTQLSKLVTDELVKHLSSNFIIYREKSSFMDTK
jgi:hypothetical protein